jgi:MFS family permease
MAYVARTLFEKHLKRSILSITLMVTQSFFYNAIFFTFALVLTKFYDVGAGDTGTYMVPFAIGNFSGPLLLGRFFDTVGRRRMIAGTYITSAVLLAITGLLFERGMLTATTQTACWCVVFFFASSAASSAYLTVSELFPVEIRGMAIAIFFSISQLAGAVAPWIFARIVASESRPAVFYGYLFGAALMALGGIVAAFIGVDAEGKSLEALSGGEGHHGG